VAGHRLLAVALLPALAAVVTACGSTHLSAAAAGASVDVTERDFSIHVSPRRLSPGPVVFRVTNRGPDAHELILVRAQPAGLPLRPDGITLNEERLDSATLGTLEPGEPGSVRELAVKLKRGRYVLFCNMSGHFMGGMRATVIVG
jgi:uncharacterized cupredoxin-like copper-binding protein